jgi:WD40 repeat protein/transcriptional regulator with XRE-family HTH domain
MSIPAREAFAARLNEVRLDRHLSISALARLVGVPKATAQGWLNGSHLPTPALRPQYLRLVAELGLSAELPNGLWLDGWADIKPLLREGRSPYLGLRQFATADVDYYCGRSEEAKRLAEAVRTLHETCGHGIVALVGPSGCGKSSLLAAGIAGRESADGSLAGWRVRFVGRDDLSGEPPDADLLILDQFEEVLFLPEDDRRTLIAQLERLAASRIVLVGLRSDAFAAAEAEPILADALARPVLVAPLTRGELREVIVQPAALAGVGVDDDLVHVLLNDLAPGSEQSRVPADVLPLLSNALLVTWAAGASERMTLADYRKAGGVAGAVEVLAEQVYTDLDGDSQAVAQRLFLRLIGLAQDVVVRRSLPLAELDAESRRVVDAFVTARMLTIDNDEVRISHEALLRHWARLAGWLEEHRAELDSLAKLRRAAELWRDTERDPHVLIPVQRLPMFTEWLDDPDRRALLGVTERDFLDASEQHFASALDEERRMSQRLRRQRRLALGLAVVTTLAAVVAGASYVRGEGFRTDAVTARNEAESRQVAVAARSLRAKSPNLVAQLALVSSGLADTQEARSIVLDAESMDAPLRWLGAANAVLAVSPDAEVVARADGSGKVTLWHAGELTTSPGTVFTADAKGGSLLAVALAAVSGREVLAVGGPNIRALWDVTAEPQLLAELDSADATTAVTFNPQGSEVAFGDAAGKVSVYRLGDASRPAVATTVALSEPATPLQVSSIALDGSGRLYVGGLPGEVDRWVVGTTVRELPSLPTTVVDSAGQLTAARVQTLALTRDGGRLAAGIAGLKVLRWNISAGDKAVADRPLASFTSWVNAVAFSADGSELGVASSDQDISLYDAANGSELRRMVTPAIQTGVGFAEDGRPVSVGEDGTLLAWAAESPLWKPTGAAIYNLATDGTRWLAAGGSTDGIALWRLGTPARRMPTPVVPVLPKGDVQRGAVGVAPNGKFLLGATLYGRVLSWPLNDSGAGTGIAYSTGVDNMIAYTAVSPDSSLVAAMEYEGTKVMLFRADDEGRLSPVATIEGKDPQLVGFSNDGKILAIAQTDKSVALWSIADPASPQLAGSITGLTAVPATLDLAPHSSRIAIGEASGEVSLWDFSDLAHPVEQRTWHDPASSMYSLDFSPDERWLVGTSGDDLIWGWDLASDATTAHLALSGEVGRPWDVRFIDDGARFAVAGNSGAVRVWTSQADAAAQQLCASIGDQLTADEWKRYLPGIEPRKVC